MNTLTLQLPDKTRDHLRAIAQYENRSVEDFAKDILVLAERELWKLHGYEANQISRASNYSNRHTL